MSLIRFILQPNKIMGFNDTVARWVIPLSANYVNKTNLICDRANEDHCGCCGGELLINNSDVNYIMNDKPNDKPKNLIVINNVFKEEEKYYYPFTL